MTVPFSDAWNVFARTSTTFNVPLIQYYQPPPPPPPVPVYVSQPNVSQPPSNNNICENPDAPISWPIFSLCSPRFCSYTAPTVHPNDNATFAPEFPPAPAAYSTTTMSANIRTPKYDGGAFPYRHHVTARLTGTVPPQFNQVVLGPTTHESQLALRCYAECRSCASSMSPKCSPVGWYLDPVRDPRYNLGFVLNPSSGPFTGNVSFTIQHRPRLPRAQDRTQRCDSEYLMSVRICGSLCFIITQWGFGRLSFLLCDYIGHVVVEKQVGPFRARSHTRKIRQNEPHQQHADGSHHLGSLGLPLAVTTAIPPFQDSVQTSSPVLPVGYSAPVYAPTSVHDPHLPSFCINCGMGQNNITLNG